MILKYNKRFSSANRARYVGRFFQRCTNQLLVNCDSLGEIKKC